MTTTPANGIEMIARAAESEAAQLGHAIGAVNDAGEALRTIARGAAIGPASGASEQALRLVRDVEKIAAQIQESTHVLTAIGMLGRELLQGAAEIRPPHVLASALDPATRATVDASANAALDHAFPASSTKPVDPALLQAKIATTAEAIHAAVPALVTAWNAAAVQAPASPGVPFAALMPQLVALEAEIRRALAGLEPSPGTLLDRLPEGARDRRLAFGPPVPPEPDPEVTVGTMTLADAEATVDRLAAAADSPPDVGTQAAAVKP